MIKQSNMKQMKILQVLCFLFLALSCSQAEKNYGDVLESIPKEEIIETSVSNISENEIVTDKLKIIKNADCRIKVNNVGQATMLSKKIVSTYKGYISNEHFTHTNYAKENKFTIRVPQENFDEVLDSICALADFVDYKNISTLDVTEEYIDIKSRLKTKLEVKQRYETILKTSTKTVEDILLTEDKLRVLQEEIEAAQGRLNYLTNRVSYSTIQFDLYETVVPKDEPQKYVKSFIEKAEDGLSFGWNLLQHLFLLLFYVWPLVLLGISVFIYFKWIRK
ncbi:DUF4349 domain-containing protein [Aquimarina sp. BL5]|nr:DUF4349 domain-containing protein [Aquimarina sp. BL5]RKN07753.1 DUF4349 domain-containing protein [Aquimarina sp. BL5]